MPEQHATPRRCDNCRWWEENEVAIDTDSLFLYGRCLIAETNFMGEANHPSSLAVASGVEGNAASLFTRADFSCLQWGAFDG